jgi:hypothetical protein
MLAPSDHCLRPVRSFLSFFGFDTHSTFSSYPPRPSFANNDTANPSTAPYEPSRPTSAPQQIQIDGPAPALASPMPPASISAPLPTFADFPATDQHDPVDPPSHPLHHVHHLTFPHPQVGQVPQPGTLLEPPFANEGPSCSQFSGPGMFPQAHGLGRQFCFCRQ